MFCWRRRGISSYSYEEINKIKGEQSSKILSILGYVHTEEMKELKDITLNEKFIVGKGTEKQIKNFNEIYKNDLVNNNKIDKIHISFID